MRFAHTKADPEPFFPRYRYKVIVNATMFAEADTMHEALIEASKSHPSDAVVIVLHTPRVEGLHQTAAKGGEDVYFTRVVARDRKSYGWTIETGYGQQPPERVGLYEHHRKRNLAGSDQDR